MDSPLKSSPKLYFDSSSISSDSKKSKEKIPSKKDDLNMDKDTLNLFKGIVKITRVNSTKVNKSPLVKSNSVKNCAHISKYIDNIYNNEEHLNNNQICTMNNLKENISPKNSTMSSIRKNITLFKKSLFNKEGSNFATNTLKKSKKNILISNNKGDMTHKYNNKSHKNYSFFFKLKEKNKIPSKTPYLDKKAWNSTYNLNQYNLEENANENKNNKNEINKISNKTFFDKYKISKKKNKLNKEIEEEKNNSLNNDNKKLPISSGGESKNNNIVVYQDKKDENDNTKKNKNFLRENNNSNIKEKKCTNNLIINILNRPFLCCLKS